MQGSRSDCAVVERSMLERATANRQPVSGTFELTARCNLACGMCYIRKPANDRYERSHELSAAQWVDVTQQAVAAGMVFLTLTGGEILIRKDFFDLYEPMTQMGLVITLFTNATAITPAVAKRLAQRRFNAARDAPTPAPCGGTTRLRRSPRRRVPPLSRASTPRPAPRRRDRSFSTRNPRPSRRNAPPAPWLRRV